MEKKIGAVTLAFFVLQASILLVCHSFFRTNGEVFTSFLIHIVLWHILLLLFLILYKGDFVNTKTNKPLNTINLANAITLFRISSVPLIAFLLRNNEVPGIKIVLTVILIFIFFTDFFDGIIARKYNQQTKIGAMLDSMSDYSLLILVSVVYYQLNILPHCFFYLIITRLALQAVGAAIFIILKFPLEPKSTIGGKITIASTMFLYTIKLLQFFIEFSNNLTTTVSILEYIFGATIFIFSFEKIIIFYRHYLEYKKQNKKIVNQN